MTWDLEARLALLAGTVTGRQFYAGPARWLSRELVRTEAAIGRLREWCIGGGLERPEPDVRRAVRFFGDESMLPIVVEALEMMAPPARAFVLQRCATYGTGWDTRGWTGPQPRPADRIILLSGARRDIGSIRLTALHEFAHAWLEPLPPAEAITAAAAADVENYFLARGHGPHYKLPAVLTSERQADALAADWERQASRGPQH